MDSKGIVGAVLAVLSLIGLLGVIAFLMVATVPAENKDLFNIALMALVGFVGTSFGYYLGSSASSTQKNDILADTLASTVKPVEK